MIVPPEALAMLLDAIADRLAARIASRDQRETYSSRELPPRCSRRRFAEVCRTGRVADAEREGRDWTCSRAAWQSARARKPAPRIVEPTTPTPLTEQADRLLARAGLRVVGGRRT